MGSLDANHLLKPQQELANMASPQSTSLRTELEVVLSNPRNFYNIIMERSGKNLYQYLHAHRLFCFFYYAYACLEAVHHATSIKISMICVILYSGIIRIKIIMD